MVSKHHACTSFGLKKKVEPALTALSVYGVALSPWWCNVVMCGAGGCGFGFADIMAFMCQRSLVN